MLSRSIESAESSERVPQKRVQSNAEVMGMRGGSISE
jgi:hypothetical protein